MIGNDIIDLRSASLQSNPWRPGFQEKIFTGGEQALIRKSAYPDLQIWILWSMKESAYKAHQRQFNLERKFNPQLLQCEISFQNEISVSGNVRIDSAIYHLQCHLSDRYIHCSATEKKEQKIFKEILPCSQNLKSSLLFKVSVEYNLPFDTLDIIKNENFIPYISLKNKTLSIPFSLSHHGNFKAFSLSLMNY